MVLDTIEALFAGLPNEAILRAELRRLFRWLKDKGVTAIITGERGDGTLTRHGLEEYVSDCVILLDHRVDRARSPRGACASSSTAAPPTAPTSIPFLIDEHGISVLPITSLGLDHPVSTERVSTGIPRLDAMLGGKGYYRGSSILVSGTAGTGKTSLAAALRRRRLPARASAASTSPSRNRPTRSSATCAPSASTWSRGSSKGLLQFHAARPTLYGLEMHLATMHKLINEVPARRPWSSTRSPTSWPSASDDEVKVDADAADRLPQEPGRSPPSSPA